jgi:uncharacterized protein
MVLRVSDRQNEKSDFQVKSLTFISQSVATKQTINWEPPRDQLSPADDPSHIEDSFPVSKIVSTQPSKSNMAQPHTDHNPLTSTDGPTAASGGELQPSPHENIQRIKEIANPAPLGLGAFAVSLFVLSLINIHTLNVRTPNILVALAFAYGGLVQLLAGMWEMAIGNTFGATVLSSYGGFWLSFGIIFTPAFGIQDAYKDDGEFHAAIALYLWAWFIFTTLCLLLTLRSTVAFAALFLVLDVTFLCLAVSEQNQGQNSVLAARWTKAGGWLGIVTAALAWWNMFAGMVDRGNFWWKVSVGSLDKTNTKRRMREDDAA